MPHLKVYFQKWLSKENFQCVIAFTDWTDTGKAGKDIQLSTAFILIFLSSTVAELYLCYWTSGQRFLAWMLGNSWSRLYVLNLSICRHLLLHVEVSRRSV